MLEHLDDKAPPAPPADGAEPLVRRADSMRRRRAAAAGTLGLAAMAAVTMTATVSWTAASDPVTAKPRTSTTTTVAEASPSNPPGVVFLTPPTTLAPPTTPPPTTPPPTSPPPTSPPPTSPPPTVPPTTTTAPPTVPEPEPEAIPPPLIWKASGPAESQTGEVSYPVTLRVQNAASVAQEYTLVVCTPRVKRVRIEGNVLVSDVDASECVTTVQAIGPGEIISSVQLVRMRAGNGKIDAGDYTLSLFGLTIPVRIIANA